MISPETQGAITAVAVMVVLGVLAGGVVILIGWLT